MILIFTQRKNVTYIFWLRISDFVFDPYKLWHEFFGKLIYTFFVTYVLFPYQGRPLAYRILKNQYNPKKECLEKPRFM